MFNPSREQVRRFFCDAWKKHQEHLPLVGAEVTAADIAARHPEYHDLLADSDGALDKEWTPEGGQTNPFLHLSLHLAIHEQVSIDQPPGIRAAYEALRARMDPHACGSMRARTMPNMSCSNAWVKPSGAPSARAGRWMRWPTSTPCGARPA
jgi:hypothetical protein